MLFLYRPRQTWMPYRPPRNRTEQGAYNREMQEKFGATRRVAGPVPKPTSPPSDTLSQLRELADLHEAGALSDEEFTRAKAKVLGSEAESA